MLTFDPDRGIQAEDPLVIRERVAEAWRTAFAERDKPALNTESSSPAGQMIDSQTADLVQKDAEILYLANQFDPRKAEGLFQEALAQIYFIARNHAEYSVADVTVTGLAGTVIPLNARVQSTADNSVWFNTAEATIPKSGTATLKFRAEDSGTVAALPHTLTKIQTLVAGWDTADNDKAALIGNNAETQAAFERRRYKSVALNSRSALASLYARITAVPQVLGVFLAQNRTDSEVLYRDVRLKPHSVYACVLGGDDSAVATALYETISAGCDFNGNTQITVTDPHTRAQNAVAFERPTRTDVEVKLFIQKNETLPSDYEERAKTAAVDNFYATDQLYIGGQPQFRVAMGDVLYASRLAFSVIDSGIHSLLGCQIRFKGKDNYTDFLQIPVNVYPELSSADIQITLIKEGESAFGAEAVKVARQMLSENSHG